MKLAFNFLNIGMGNNGGTRTLIKCADTLTQLGYSTVLLSKVDKFTWFKHQKPLKTIPQDLDVLIAASCKDIQSTLKANTQKKAWYIRAHETWLINEKKLNEIYQNPHIIKFVNSIGLQNKLKEVNADSIVIYQGIDFDLWKNLDLRPKNKIRIGCLHTNQKRKRWIDFIQLAKILGTKNYEYVGVGSSKPNDTFLSDFKVNAPSTELQQLYSSCHIWFAPTNSEGLHNVPMEASLCGALVVCSDHPLNGMSQDYAFPNTAMIYHYGNISQAAKLIQNPNWKLISNLNELIKLKIGTRQDNMLKLISYLS